MSLSIPQRYQKFTYGCANNEKLDTSSNRFANAVIHQKNVMKIGINARYLQKRASGIENYIHHVLSNLSVIDTTNEYILFFGSHAPLPDGLLSGNMRASVTDARTDTQINRLIWGQYHLPHELRRLGIDLFHEPSFIAPIWKTVPTIVTIYDLAPHRFPHFYDRRTRWFLKSLLPLSIRSSDKIIAISQHTKRDIVEYYGVEPEKIEVVYCGCNPIYRPLKMPERIEHLRGQYAIRTRYLLTVSMISPRKNMVRLLEAFSRYKDRTRDDVQLVIVGTKGWMYEEVFRTTERLSLGGEVVFTGFVSDDDLLAFYNHAEAMIFPSMYEGFGIPVVEAMACGCPVICSHSSSLPEVGGDAVEYVDPECIDSISDSIGRVLCNASIRDSLIRAGTTQAAKFSWRRAAEETLHVYRDVHGTLQRDAKVATP